MRSTMGPITRRLLVACCSLARMSRIRSRSSASSNTRFRCSLMGGEGDLKQFRHRGSRWPDGLAFEAALDVRTPVLGLVEDDERLGRGWLVGRSRSRVRRTCGGAPRRPSPPQRSKPCAGGVRCPGSSPRACTVDRAFPAVRSGYRSRTVRSCRARPRWCRGVGTLGGAITASRRTTRPARCAPPRGSRRAARPRRGSRARRSRREALR
jgi:hypothetical protein